MLKHNRSRRLLVAAAGISLLGACASESPPQAKVAAPEPAGGWYQVLFDTNQSNLTAQGQMIVDNVAMAVKSDGSARVTIIGRTDRVGTAAANLALSEKRAERVRDALVATGFVPANRIETRWLGEGKQEVATADDVADQRNRVVDITVQ